MNTEQDIQSFTVLIIRTSISSRRVDTTDLTPIKTESLAIIGNIEPRFEIDCAKMGGASSLIHADVEVSNSNARLSQFQFDLRTSALARRYFSEFILSLESTEEVIKEIRNTEINFAESLDESFKAGFVKSDIIVVYLLQFFKSQKYEDYCNAQSVSGTPILTRTNSNLE